MKHHTHMSHRLVGSLITIGAGLIASAAVANPVDMPTPTGTQSFESTGFASGIMAEPLGQFACFTDSALSPCTVSTLNAAVLGPDLINGLTLGLNGEIKLLFESAGSALAIWEAGNISSTGDTEISYLSVHTSAGWSQEIDYGSGHILPVLNDTQPSGYPTNYSSFSATDFGLILGQTFDALLIRACCTTNAHLDILAVTALPSAVPEPSTAALTLLGLLGIGLFSIKRTNAFTHASKNLR